MINNMKLSKITKSILKNSNIIPLLYSNLFYNSFNTLEHIYPKSYIKNISHNYDIHNIYTSNYNMNALRSNYKYSELNKKDKNIININGNLICKDERLFCPIDSDKGIIARALLYMKDSYGYKDFGNYTLYKEWNEIFRPEIKELFHNEYGYLYQGTRNKYIDMHYKNDFNYSYKINMIKEDIIFKLELLKKNGNEFKTFLEWKDIIDKWDEPQIVVDDNKILNPKSGRYVLKSGKVGKELVINQNKLN